jgi:Family of unknown function (DUF6335)
MLSGFSLATVASSDWTAVRGKTGGQGASPAGVGGGRMKKRAAKSTTRSSRTNRRGGRAQKRSAKSTGGAGAAARRARSSAAKGDKRPAKRKARAKGPGRARPRPRRAPEGAEDAGRIIPLHAERVRHHETSPALSAGDLDADWMGSELSGEESAGGSVATPDQSVVDEIGRALGVEQAPSQPVTSSAEILRERARHRWDLEREASEDDDRRER